MRKSPVVSFALCLRVLLWVLLLLCVVPNAHAGGPRFTSALGWGVPSGRNVVWGTTSLAYYTDPGDLNAHVSHAQADAMVAAAAAVWTAPTSAISYMQGGVLAEDVSTANTYFDGTQLVFPADVQTSNEGNIPVAIVYDMDGGLIDLLLGGGASDPDECRQNSVVGDIDDIQTWGDGLIHHATLILNGRCVGSAPEQMTEMQYHLARAFGRVLGLAWSQTNDNVFTAQTTVTANQMAYWPLMHPIDVICGNYSYQCMTNPFLLRVDDLNSLADLIRYGSPQCRRASRAAITMRSGGGACCRSRPGKGWSGSTSRLGVRSMPITRTGRRRPRSRDSSISRPRLRL